MVSIQFLAHSFFKIQNGGGAVLVDPFIAGKSASNVKRLIDCPCSEKQLKDISAILITHEHFDHFDRELIEHIVARDNALVVAHDSVLNQLNISKRNVCPINANGSVSVRGIKVKAFSAHHPQSFYPLSYLIEMDGQRIFHAGDTDTMEGFFETIKCDTAMLPIGGTMTMDLVDAVKTTKAIKPKIVIPMHYNTFSVIQVDPMEFKTRIEKTNLKTKVAIMNPGETLEL